MTGFGAAAAGAYNPAPPPDHHIAAGNPPTQH
jgi:hypothetical protein